MSCIICIFTPNKIVISSDSAVSSDNRTYTGVEKIIPLSNDPPLTIAIYGNSDFGEIPLENIISEYVKKTDFKKINTVVKVKKDFLNYIHEIIPKETIDEFLRKKIRSFKDEIKDLDEIGLIYYFSKCQEKETMNIFENYEFNFDELLPKDLTKTQKEIFNANMNNIFLSLVSDELSGIIIAGIDKKTLKSSYTSFEMLLNEPHSVSIHNENEEIDINGSKIKVFAQNDVIKGFFKGIDDELLSQISSEIEN